MTRTPLQAYIYVLVVVQNGKRFLLVKEAEKERGSWYLPAGGVLPGESLIAAAVRETREESGIDVTPSALLWMEDLTDVSADGIWSGRWRFVLRADPVDTAQIPGPTADSLDAGWFTPAEIAELPLRSPEALIIIQAVKAGVPELPINRAYLKR